ncbi:unnamed protein product [Durusdinium trenchii]|uniref:Uncharacterized protein n=1 Tax=Durusdinium trenchii TaxID=1381693 RepID=A0ABP0JA39_9DINO
MSQEIYYYAGDGARITQDDVTSTAMTLQAQTQPDAKTLSDLTAEGAPLAAGALPDLQTVGADGSKGVWTAMGSTVSKARIKKREDTEQAVEVKPKTSQERAKDTMKALLAEAGEARKLSISLQAVEYGGELTKQLLDESKKMEKLFTNYTDLVKRKVTDDSKYDSAADQADQKMKWLEKAKAAAKSLLAGLNKKAPKKKAAKKEKVAAAS